MDSFIVFADNTKQDFFLITGGLVLIGMSSFTKTLVGKIGSNSLKFIGVVMISIAALILSSHIKSFFKTNPKFFEDHSYAPYRRNIYAGCAVCIILFALVVYATISIFFN